MFFDNAYKVTSKLNEKIHLHVVPGHFATSHSHINSYLDMTTLKVRHSEAAEEQLQSDAGSVRYHRWRFYVFHLRCTEVHRRRGYGAFLHHLLADGLCTVR